MQALHHTLMRYAQQHLTTLPQDYRWKLKPEHVEQAFGLALPADSFYAMTRAVKRGLADQWQTMPHRRLALADYAVREFGGVRTNAPATLQSYVDIISQGRVPETVKGIASWSKVAAFSDPQAHAIFDARVAFSLNALQWLAGQAPCWWFPQLPGRNKLLTATWPLLKAQRVKQGWLRQADDVVYGNYLASLRTVAQELGAEIDDIEMILFAKAETLAQQVRQQLNDPSL